MSLSTTGALLILAAGWLTTVVLAVLIARLPRTDQLWRGIYLGLMIFTVLVIAVVVRDTWYVDTL